MVAASIQGADAFGQGAFAGLDLITPSSHGWLMIYLSIRRYLLSTSPLNYLLQ